jgi:hypothetical protein
MQDADKHVKNSRSKCRQNCKTDSVPLLSVCCAAAKCEFNTTTKVLGSGLISNTRLKTALTINPHDPQRRFGNTKQVPEGKSTTRWSCFNWH